MHRIIMAAILTAMAAALVGCEPTTEPTTEAALAPTSADFSQVDASELQTQSNGFVIVGAGNGLPRNLESQVRAAGGVLTGTVPEINIAFASSDDPGFGDRLKGVQFVGPDVLSEAPQAESFPAADAVSPAATVDGIGDDEPYYPLLWGLQAVRAPQAWDANVLGDGVVVAVLDEGFGLGHGDVPFLAGQAESFACWGVVVIGGITYVDQAPPPYCESPEYGAGYTPPGYFTLGPITDVFSHGTHVSGTIAGLDNGFGVIGVAPGAEILPVKVLSEYLGGGYTSWIIQGIIYAANQGADVINMSLGGTATIGGPGTSDVMRASIVAYRRAINYAKQMGVTVVVSAGNGYLDADGDGKSWIRPAEFETPVTVSATAPYGIAYDPSADLDELAHYSNTGKSLVDFAAPGGDFDHPGGLYYFDMVLSTGAQGGYYWSAGTSMASPHVAGIAALIIGESGGDMSPAQVEAELRKRAVDLGKPGNDDAYGKGRVSSGY
ncbi:MAG: S8 family serine peptidase [Gemmatimonadota bacterium]